MRVIILFSLILLIFACSQEEEITEVTKIFSMDEVSTAGFKVKKDFNTEFPDSTDAKWGFYKGRDVAVLRYASLELANSAGALAGREQTEQIEVVEKNIAHGPKVERTECRGHKQNKPNSSSVYYKSFRNNLGFENSLIVNKNAFIEEFDNSEPMKPSWMACVRREPMYTEFKIHGNLIILMEPLATEDQNDTRKFLDKAASSIK
ncbi:MAG: hypothetical protein CL762_05065 [Chloroflexi bacterium]|nr:hypothetical protein [Chloroflexota bacterium]MBM02068.1 hypothetical protein [Chloroflexota bacterium]|tara:strand:- start:661 stop:1275 length:615 start_codon:yes stop_codon:yes gene_type:complete